MASLIFADILNYQIKIALRASLFNIGRPIYVYLQGDYYGTYF